MTMLWRSITSVVFVWWEQHGMVGLCTHLFPVLHSVMLCQQLETCHMGVHKCYKSELFQHFPPENRLFNVYKHTANDLHYLLYLTKAYLHFTNIHSFSSSQQPYGGGIVGSTLLRQRGQATCPSSHRYWAGSLAPRCMFSITVWAAFPFWKTYYILGNNLPSPIIRACIVFIIYNLFNSSPLVPVPSCQMVYIYRVQGLDPGVATGVPMCSGTPPPPPSSPSHPTMPV